MTDRIRTTHVGSLPRSQEVSQLLFAAEAGEPVLVTFPDSEQSGLFREIAGRLAARVSVQARSFQPLSVIAG